jgi:DNA-binding GntR family transcriptional regulator
VTNAVLSISVDRASPVPLYFQVAQRLERAIEAGDLPAGSMLDNELDLAERLGLSRPTVRRAIQYLVDRGLLVRKRGVGTQVVRAKVRRPVELTSLYDDLSATDRRPRTRVLSFELEPASDVVAHALSIPEGAEVYAIERLRYADEKPLAVLRNQVPAELIKLSREALETHGLYEILRANGIALRIASQTIGARTASAGEARMLDETRGAPLLTMARTVYDDHGHAVEHGDHIYRASLYAFELTLTSS